ncbi:MAG: PD-(D/E)XK nuclease family protein [Thermoanaerobaculaceae bacterium]
MSLSTLVALERCPLQWALSNATYPTLWHGRGYPPKVHLPSLAGAVVHLTVRNIVLALVHEGCLSPMDPKASEVMARLGGYTSVLSRSIDQVTAHLSENPRAVSGTCDAVTALNSRLPELRLQTQRLLGSLRFEPRPLHAPAPHAASRRGPLSEGTHAEVDLEAPCIAWKGRADLLTLAPGGCRITEFKTGEARDEHRFQARVYALLWARDTVLNPRSVPVTGLILSYPSSEYALAAPTDTELDQTQTELVDRTRQALLALSDFPPQPRPGGDACRGCSVRHMCLAYWEKVAQSRRLLERQFADLEVRVSGNHGPRSWEASLLTEPNEKQAETSVILRSHREAILLQSGQCLRVLDALFEPSTEDPASPPSVTICSSSEVYLVRE